MKSSKEVKEKLEFVKELIDCVSKQMQNYDLTGKSKFILPNGVISELDCNWHLTNLIAQKNILEWVLQN